MTTWYRVIHYGKLIQRIKNVIKESPEYITYIQEVYSGTREVREKKDNQYSNCFPTFLEAQNFAVAFQQSRIRRAKDQIEEAEVNIRMLNQMTEEK